MDLHTCRQPNSKQSEIIEYKNCVQHNMEYKFKNGKVKKKKGKKDAKEDKSEKEENDEGGENIEDKHGGGAPILEFSLEKGQHMNFSEIRFAQKAAIFKYVQQFVNLNRLIEEILEKEANLSAMFSPVTSWDEGIKMNWKLQLQNKLAKKCKLTYGFNYGFEVATNTVSNYIQDDEVKPATSVEYKT